MTLIDQAVMKAFQRREQPSVKPSWSDLAVHRVGRIRTRGTRVAGVPSASESKRELFVHAPETLLRGLHHFPGTNPELWAQSRPRPAAPTDQVTDHDRADGDVVAHPRTRARVASSGFCGGSGDESPVEL